MKRNKYTLGLFITIVAILMLPTVMACEGFELGKGVVDKRAEIQIWSIGPRNFEGYVSPQVSCGCARCSYVLPYLTAEKCWHFTCPKCGDTLVRAQRGEPKVEFHVRVKPLNVTPDVNYALVLLSRTGYLYDLLPMLWKKDDFAGVGPDERDIRKIREAENKSTRLEVFYVDSSDKEIDPLIREFNRFYSECREMALARGELQFRGDEGWNAGSFEPDESDFQRICNKYIEIKLLTFEECKSIEGAGPYLGF